MAEGINYDISAFLRTKGSFASQLKTSSAAADKFGSKWSQIGGRVQETGHAISGSFGSVVRSAGSMVFALGAAGIGGALVGAVAQGISFNDTMEQGALGVATMYQTFGLASNEVDVLTGKTTEFAKSLEFAEAMQSSLFEIAKKSPATFEDMAAAYEGMAPGVTGVTKDLKRQRDLMERMAVMAFTTGGDYRQMGTDVGRIVQGLAGADVRVFKTLEPAIKEAFSSVTGEDAAADFAKQFNQIKPEQRLAVFEAALAKVPNEVNQAFGQSFGGLMSSVKSQMQVLGGGFGKPLVDSLKKNFARLVGDDGILGGNFGGLETAASFAGQQLAVGADKLFRALERGAEYVASNWDKIAKTLQEAGVLAGAAIKTAMVVGTTRMIAGAATIAAGKGISAATAIGGAAGRGREAFGQRARAQHMRTARGMKGKKGGGLMGKGLGKIFGKLGSGGGIFKGLDKGILKIATMGTMMTAMAGAAGLIAIAFSGVIVVVGGLAAYMISNWKAISGSIREGLESGRITLVPLITALYTFYERLRLVGEAIFGGTDAAGSMMGMLNMMTASIDFASVVLAGMIDAIGIMIGAWAALKFGFGSFLGLLADGLILMSKIPGAGDGLADAAASLKSTSEGIKASGLDTSTTADKFSRAADAVREAQLDPMKFKAAQDKAKSLEQTLANALDPNKKDDKKLSKGAKIGPVNVVIDARDTDPDRLMAAFVEPLEKLGNKRTAPYGQMEQGS